MDHDAFKYIVINGLGSLTKKFLYIRVTFSCQQNGLPMTEIKVQTKMYEFLSTVGILILLSSEHYCSPLGLVTSIE